MVFNLLWYKAEKVCTFSHVGSNLLWRLKKTINHLSKWNIFGQWTNSLMYDIWSWVSSPFPLRHCFAILGLYLPLKYPCLNVYGTSLLRGSMLLLLVSPSIVGDQRKVVGEGAWVLWAYVYVLSKSCHFNKVTLSVSQITPHVFPFASHRMSRCKFEAPHPLHSSSPQAHGSSEHKHVSGQGKYLERRITDTESCEVYLELQMWKGHIFVRQRFSEVKDALSLYVYPPTSFSQFIPFFPHLERLRALFVMKIGFLKE